MARFLCPKCNHSLEVADEYIGKKLRCPECQAVGIGYRSPPATTEFEFKEPDSAPAPAFQVAAVPVPDENRKPILIERAPQKRGGWLVHVFTVLSVILYALLGLGTLGGLVLFVMVAAGSENTPQLAAVSAAFAAWFVGTYVTARSFEKFSTLLKDY